MVSKKKVVSQLSELEVKAANTGCKIEGGHNIPNAEVHAFMEDFSMGLAIASVAIEHDYYGSESIAAAVAYWAMKRGELLERREENDRKPEQIKMKISGKGDQA